MAALLKNATVAYSRSVYNATTGNTAAPTPFGSITAHVMPKSAVGLILLPDAAMVSDIIVRCDSNVDIQEGDIVTSIVTTNVPSLNWPSVTPNPNEILSVVFVNESTAGIPELEYRDAFIKRARIGGPSNA